MNYTSKIENIFLALDANNLPTSHWQFLHFIDELSRNNIQFTIFNRSEYPKNNCDEILLQQFHSCKKNISLFMTGYLDDQISIETINNIKKTGIPTLLICYDNLLIPHYQKKIAPHFDLVWLTSLETEHLFKNWGAKTIFLPYAANPYKFFPSKVSEIYCVGFIGSLYGSRKYKIQILDNNSIPTHVFSNQGNKAQNGQIKQEKIISNKLKLLKKGILKDIRLVKFSQGRILLKGNFKKGLKKRFEQEHNFKPETQFFNSPSFEEMIRLYSEFAISLGIIDTWNTYLLKKPLFKLHLRTFEIPMCGGLQIVNRTPELQNYFDEGKEIILYDSNEDMIDKIQFYLLDKNTNLRLKMKLAARIRAENDHTWSKRFQKISETLYK